MSIQWNEIKSRALLFSQTWADACNEKSQSSHFWIDFMGIFGIPNKRMVSFEHNVQKLNGAKGYVDLFWPGKLLVEQKSLGKDLKDACALDWSTISSAIYGAQTNHPITLLINQTT